MTLDTARKVLKISGIIIIILAVLTAILGVMLAAGGGFAVVSMPEVQTDPDYQTAAGVLVIVGIFLVISGIVSIIEGIFSILASKNNKYGTVAWVFAILGLISSVVSAANGLKNSTSFSTLIGTIIGILIGIVILVAANTVRQARKSEVPVEVATED